MKVTVHRQRGNVVTEKSEKPKEIKVVEDKEKETLNSNNIELIEETIVQDSIQEIKKPYIPIEYKVKKILNEIEEEIQEQEENK